MKLKIRSIQEHGDATKEYVIIDVLEDCDVGRHGLADTTFTSEHKVSNRLRHFYWFPDQNVKKGDTVKLMTGVGKNTSSTNLLGQTVYTYYWRLKSAVWNDDGDAAVLFEMSNWKTAKA